MQMVDTKIKKAFTLVESLIVVAIIALLAAIVMPNLLRAKMTANDTDAAMTLKTMATASDTFAISHQGNYPATVGDLTSSTPRYLNRDYTASPFRGYEFACAFFAQGYTCTATPTSCNQTGSKQYTITTGAILTHSDCM